METNIPRAADEASPGGIRGHGDDIEAYVPFRVAYLARPDSNGTPIRTFGEHNGWLLSLLVVAIGGLSLMATTMSYSRREVARGAIAPKAGATQVATSRDGIVSALHVADGQQVRRGAPLFELAVDANVQQGRLGDILSSVADMEESALAQQSDARRNLLASERKDLAVRRARILDETRSLGSQRELIAKQANDARDTVNQMRRLSEKGFASAFELRQYENNLVQATLALSNLDQRRTNLARDLEQLQVEPGRLNAQAADIEASARASGAQLAEKRAALSSQQTLVIPAPIDGRLTALRVREGQSVARGEVVATLLPYESNLIGEAWLPSSAIGFVRKGDPVRLRYDGFPHQQFGMAEGRVAYVSDVPVARAPEAGPRIPTEPLYLVKIELTRQSMRAFDREWPLVPGMGLTAVITLERRSFLFWVLDPVFRARASRDRV